MIPKPTEIKRILGYVPLQIRTHQINPAGLELYYRIRGSYPNLEYEPRFKEPKKLDESSRTLSIDDLTR